VGVDKGREEMYTMEFRLYGAGLLWCLRVVIWRMGCLVIMHGAWTLRACS